MKAGAGILLGFISLVSTVQIQATILPDACGKDGEKFTVTTEKSQSPPASTEIGQARIVFIEAVEKESVGFCIGCAVTTRVGLDGTWVGANKGNSYFVQSVSAGEHHLCANWQSSIGSLDKNVDVAALTAEPGKVYYFEAKVVIEQRDAGHGQTYEINQLKLKQLSDDEGQYLVKISALSTAKPNK